MAFSRQVTTRRRARIPHVTSLALSALLLLPLASRGMAAGTATDPAPATNSAAGSDTPTSPASGDLDGLQRDLQRQAEQIRELEKRLASDEAILQSTATTASSNPDALIGTFGPEGFTLASADGLNVIHFRGNLSLDYRYFDDDYTPATADTFLVRKARPTLEGTFDGIFDFRLMEDFGDGKQVLDDAWVDARVEHWLVFQAGKFKAPVGLQRLQLEDYSRFIEAPLTADLLPYRDLGLMVSGALGPQLLTYQFGAFDGAPDGGSTDANSVPDANSTGKTTWDARIFSHPFALSDWSLLKQLGLGVAGTYVNYSGTITDTSTVSLLTADKTTGQQPMFSYRGDTATTFNNATIARGIDRRLDPQLNYYYQSFGMLAEYVKETQQVFRDLTATTGRGATLNDTAWEVEGYYFLTGEHEAYDSAAPLRPVGHGGFGAVELVARYHEIHYDDNTFSDGSDSFANPVTSARAAHAIGAGINWYLTDNVRVQLDYENTSFLGGIAGGSRPDERVLTSQFALIF
jgi:phosphate-selective porin OprO and OprP